MNLAQRFRDKKLIIVLFLTSCGVFTIARLRKQREIIDVVQYSNSETEALIYRALAHEKSSDQGQTPLRVDRSTAKDSSSQISTTTASSKSSADVLNEHRDLDHSLDKSAKVLTFTHRDAKPIGDTFVQRSNSFNSNVGKADAFSTGDFYQVSEGVYIYAGFIDRRYNAVTIRLIGLQDTKTSSNITCTYRKPKNKPSSGNSADEIVVSVANAFTIYADWPSPNLRYLAYEYACHTPKGWFNRTNPACSGNPGPVCGVNFSVLSADGRYETAIPLRDQSPESFNYLKKNVPEKKTKNKNNNDDNNLDSDDTKTENESSEMRTNKDVLLCVKAVYGTPSPTKLAEWVEFNRELGVDKIVIYDVASVGDGKRVLDYYSKTGYVEVVQFYFALQMKPLTLEDPYQKKLADGVRMMDEQSYLVALNDCFYRYLGQYRYVLVIDWDEVVIPTSPGQLIADMADRAVVKLPDAVALMLSTAWHFDRLSEDENIDANDKDDKPSNGTKKSAQEASDAAPYLHMQNHLIRTPVMKASQPKPIIVPYYALAINWHSVTRVPTLGDGIIRSNIPVSWQRYGFVHHFRRECKHEPVECGLLLTMGQTDDIIPRYRDTLETRVGRVVKELKLKV